jgi:hypothetical protein
MGSGQPDPSGSAGNDNCTGFRRWIFLHLTILFKRFCLTALTKMDGWCIFLAMQPVSGYFSWQDLGYESV